VDEKYRAIGIIPGGGWMVVIAWKNQDGTVSQEHKRVIGWEYREWVDVDDECYTSADPLVACDGDYAGRESNPVALIHPDDDNTWLTEAWIRNAIEDREEAMRLLAERRRTQGGA